MTHVILQTPATKETMQMTHASCLENTPITSIESLSIGSLYGLQNKLLDINILPVGSVEFLREAMRVIGLKEPENMSYPEVLSAYLEREIRKTSIADALNISKHEDVFVKPANTKIFTGFVLQNTSHQVVYDAHDQEQFNTLVGLHKDTPVWVCKPFEFLCEWRYYIHNGSLIGSARYDHYGDDDIPDPNIETILAAISQLKGSQPMPLNCALDFGISKKTGNTVLVECNDAWAIGLYGKALGPLQYFLFLRDRWNQINATSSLNKKISLKQNIL